MPRRPGRFNASRRETDSATILEVRAEHARRNAGADAQKSGAQFEKALADAHELYKSMGYASIEQRPVDTSQMPQSYLSRLGAVKTKGRARQLSKRAGYDYYGVLGPWAGPDEDLSRFFGRSIAMEAKSTKTEKTRLPISSSGGVQEHQLRSLVSHARDFGGVSVVVWNNGGDRLVATSDILIRTLDDYDKKGLRSIPESWFAPYKVHKEVKVKLAGAVITHREVEDWLQPVFEWLEKHNQKPEHTKIPNPRAQ